MSLGRIKRMITAPSRKLHDVKMQTFWTAGGMLYQVRRPVMVKYELLEKKTHQAIKEIRENTVSAETFKFFSNMASQKTALKFGKSEEDKAIREKILLITIAISEKKIDVEHADWIETVFVPFLEKTKQSDLKVVSQERLQKMLRVKDVDVFGEENCLPEGLPQNSESLPVADPK